jgi:hypothetical protein
MHWLQVVQILPAVISVIIFMKNVYKCVFKPVLCILSIPDVMIGLCVSEVVPLVLYRDRNLTILSSWYARIKLLLFPKAVLVRK